jgi:hypothetical protein
LGAAARTASLTSPQPRASLQPSAKLVGVDTSYLRLNNLLGVAPGTPLELVVPGTRARFRSPSTADIVIQVGPPYDKSPAFTAWGNLRAGSERRRGGSLSRCW